MFSSLEPNMSCEQPQLGWNKKLGGAREPELCISTTHPSNVAKFISSYGVGCTKKSYVVEVSDVGKIKMLIIE